MPSKKKDPSLNRILGLIFPWVFVLILAEIGFRFLPERYLEFRVELDERSLAYRFDETLGWFPKPNSKQEFSFNRTFEVSHNSDGFRDKEHGPKTKYRVLFIGDSFVWGYDAKRSERFTEKLQLRIPNWEILNLGVSGYGTDQEYLMLKSRIAKYQPDLVFLVFCHNDPGDNIRNKRWGEYYKPFFEETPGGLVLKGVPVPKSLNYYYAEHRWMFHSYIIRAVMAIYTRYKNPSYLQSEVSPTKGLLKEFKKLSEQHNSKFMIGFIEGNDELQAFASQNGIPNLALKSNHKIPPDVGHWLPKGHDEITDQIFNFWKTLGMVK